MIKKHTVNSMEVIPEFKSEYESSQISSQMSVKSINKLKQGIESDQVE